MPQPSQPFVAPGPLTASSQRAIEQYLADTIPSGRTGVALGVVTQDGVAFGAAMRLGDRWQLAGGVERSWSGEVSGRIVVMGSW